MPQYLIPGIAKLVAAGTATLLQTAAFYAVSIGVSLVANWIMSALLPQPEFGGTRGFLVNAVDPTAPAEFVIGEVRKGGVITYDETTDDNNILHRIIVLAAERVDSIGDIYLNDEVVTLSDNDYSETYDGITYDGAGWVTSDLWTRDSGEPRIRVLKHIGDQTTTSSLFSNSDDASISSTLIDASDNGLDSNFVGKNLAYLYVRLDIDNKVFEGGIPTITAKVKGALVYDPRDTNTAWDDNWALGIRHYLTADWGLGDASANIDDTVFSAQADICDEDVTLDAGGTQKRYRMNGVIRADQTPGTILNNMMPSGAGSLFWGQGLWRLRAGHYTAPVKAFTIADFRSGIRLDTRASRRDVFNAVRGEFISSEQRYIPAEYPKVESATFLAEDNGVENVLNFDLPFETDNVRAQRLAKLTLLRAREQIKFSADFSLEALDVEPGEIIELTVDRYGWDEKEFEVTEWALKFNDEGAPVVGMTLQEISEAVFDWDADEASFAANNTNLPSIASGFDLEQASSPATPTNMFPNGSFHGGFSRGITLTSDLDEAANELNVSTVPRNASSDFIPERTCPFGGMLKIEMGAAGDSVAEYEVNSTDAANSDHPNYTREHVFLSVNRLMPLPTASDVSVLFWMAELEGDVDNGWTDDGDYGPFVRMYFYDADGVKITSGQTYDDHYALIAGPPPSALNEWRKVSAIFETPDTAAYCSFEFVGLGNDAGQAIGFGVTYISGIEITPARETQFLSRGSIHTKGGAEGSDLVPTTDDTAEVVLTYTITIPALPASDTGGEDVTLEARAGGFVKTSGGESVEFFIRLDTVNGNGIDYAVQTDLNLFDSFTVSAGSSYTVDLTMKSTDVTVTELDNGYLDIEAILR